MGSNYPCRDCEKRHLGCHAECEEYKAMKAEEDARHQDWIERNAPDVAHGAHVRQAMNTARKFERNRIKK